MAVCATLWVEIVYHPSKSALTKRCHVLNAKSTHLCEAGTPADDLVKQLTCLFLVLLIWQEPSALAQHVLGSRVLLAAEAGSKVTAFK